MPNHTGSKTPSNFPHDGNLFSRMLDAMSVQELTDALNSAVENMSEECYDPDLIDAYLDALEQKDPMPDFPDAEASYACFLEKLRRYSPENRNKLFMPSRTLRQVLRTGLAAALAVVCMFGCMVVAQAAGVDVFGAMARWTDNVFSFGEIMSDGAVDVPNDPNATDLPSDADSAQTDGEIGGFDSDSEFASLQEALDAYGVTEVSEPLWLPEGFIFKRVTADFLPDVNFLYLAAEYLNGTNALIIQVQSYCDTPTMQVEKSDAPVETFTVNDTMVYLLENMNSYTAAWVTEHYECYIGGAVDKNELRKMVRSIYPNA